MNDVLFPIKPGSNLTIDWGDGTVETYTGDGSEGFVQNWLTSTDPETTLADFVVGDTPYHQYADSGTYEVKMWGRISGFWLAPPMDSMKYLIETVSQWGDLVVEEWSHGIPMSFQAPNGDMTETFGSPFMHRRMFDITATDAPKFPTNASLQSLFFGARFNSDISNWDTANVGNMSDMFRESQDFDQDLSGWEVSNVQAHSRFADNSPYNLTPEKWPRFAYSAPIAVDYTPLTLTVETVADSGGVEEPMLANGATGNYVSLNIDMGGGDGPILENGAASEDIIVIDWGDGFVEDYRTAAESDGGIILKNGSQSVSHVYAEPGQYTVKIWGVIPGWYSVWEDSAESRCLKDVVEWGETQIRDYQNMFSYKTGFAISATDKPKFAPNTVLDYLFQECHDFNSDIGHWDVSNVVSMYGMFEGARLFNQPLATWDISGVNDTARMFSNMDFFNQDLSAWDMSNVTKTYSMFSFCSAFNQPVGDWDVSSITDMNRMFQGADAFNQDLSLWDVRNVTDFERMFSNAGAFDRDLSAWQVQPTANFYALFQGGPNETVLDRYPLDPVVMTFDLRNKTSTSTVLDLKLANGQIVVDWGDGTTDTQWSHDYGEQKEVTVRYLGTYIRYNDAPWDDREGVLTDVVDWGQVPLDIRKLFKYRKGFAISAPNSPVFSTTSLNGLFWNCEGFNEDISHWDVSEITDFTSVFMYCTTFNQDLSTWQVGKGTTFRDMFYGCQAFNQDLSGWDMSSATNLMQMFLGCSVFNSPLNTWDVSKVTTAEKFLFNCPMFNQPMDNWVFQQPVNVSEFYKDCVAFNSAPFNWAPGAVTQLRRVFSGCTAFNQPLLAWSMEQVTDLSGLFYYAESFNQDLDHWDVSGVDRLSQTFEGAKAFNGKIETWDVSNVMWFIGTFNAAESFNRPIGSWTMSAAVDLSDMFKGAASFNQHLDTWDVSAVTDMDEMFHGATAFNGNVSTWNVGLVTDFRSMFQNATAFNGDIAGWDMRSARYTSQMLYNAPAFNRDLSAWEIPVDARHWDFAQFSGIHAVPEKWPWKPHVLVYNTEGNTPGNDTIDPGVLNNMHVIWSDGTTNWDNGEFEQRKTFATPGVYTAWMFGWGSWNITLPEESRTLVEVVEWGEDELYPQDMFRQRLGFTISASNGPLLTRYSRMDSMFRNAAEFNDPIEHWDVSQVQYMRHLFNGASAFNQSLEGWIMSDVMYVDYMFNNARAFNQPLNQWDVSYVRSMEGMFSNAVSFNQPLDQWVTSRVTNMQYMFNRATAFDQDLSMWDTSGGNAWMLGTDFATSAGFGNSPEKWPVPPA